MTPYGYFIILFLGLSQVCYGQISVGPRFGLNIADIKELSLPFSAENDFFNPKVSYHVGGFVKIPTAEKVYILGEVVYSRKGSRIRDQRGNRFNFQLNYLTVPTIIGFQINDWSLFFGTELGFRLGTRRSNSLVDVGLVGGAKYYIAEKFQLGLRFIQGLSALNNTGLVDGGGVTGLNRLRNQTWQLSLSYDLIQF